MNSVCISAAWLRMRNGSAKPSALTGPWRTDIHSVVDVSFNDHQMRARTKAAAQNLSVLKHITLNLIRLDPVKRKGSIKTRRIIAATSDLYPVQLLGLG